MRTLPTLLATLLLVTAAPRLWGAETIVDTYDDGSKKCEYKVDSDGRRHGRYVEWYPDGEERITARYRRGKLHGTYREYHPSGKVKILREYKRGDFSGKILHVDAEGRITHRVVVRKGQVHYFPDPNERRAVPLYLRPREEVVEALEEFAPDDYANGAYTKEKLAEEYSLSPPTAGQLTDAYLEASVKRAELYRFLAGIPHDLDLDPELNRTCQHAAVLLAVIGRLTHHPQRPAGMDETFFQKGYEGTSNSNLHQGQSNLVDAIDGFMDDSDPSNIGRVGHRRWILNPAMKKIGLGEAEGFVALWTMDKSRGHTKYELVPFPGPGHYPARLVGTHYAWSVGVNQNKYRFQDGEIDVGVYRLGPDYEKTNRIDVENVTVSRDPYGIRPTIIFRPRLRNQKLAGKRFLVEIRGPADTRGRDYPIVYLVDFF